MYHDPMDPRLREALAATADSDRTRGASTRVEQQLRATVRANRAATDRRTQIVWLAAAAAIIIAVTSVRWQMSQSDAGQLEAGPASRGPAYASGPADAVPADFIPLRYANVPVRNGQIVQIAVPASALASFGLQPTGGGGGAVNAEVFVGEDGLARAVRFSPFSTKELPQ